VSSRLSDEIAKLVARTRHHRIHDHDAINELNIVAGYAYLLQFHPQCREKLRKHLEAFSDFACTRANRELYEHATHIIEIMNGSGSAS
jgi:hypothetical protein